MMSPPPYFPWGGLDYPTELLGDHFLMLGQTGSGKTLTLRMLMESALVGFRDGGRCLRSRAVIYDPKLEFYTILRTIGIPADDIIVLNPFDERANSWDAAKDVLSESEALQLAARLMPTDPQAKDSFFASAAQDMLQSVINVLRETANRDWTLYDAVRLCLSKEDLELCLRQTQDGECAREAYFGMAHGAGDTIATLRATLMPLLPVLRIWHGCKARSLRDWLNPAAPPKVLLLGRHEGNARALDAVNGALLHLLSDLILCQPASENPTEVWFFLDEARLAGALQGLPALLLKGRSYGARLVLALQDVAGFRAVYGPDVTAEVLGMCGNIAIHKLRNPETMNWASELFAAHEWYTPSYNSSVSTSTSSSIGGASSSSSNSTGSSFARAERRAFIPQQFASLARPTPQTGLECICLTPEHAWHGRASPEFLSLRLRDVKREERRAFPGFIERMGRAEKTAQRVTAEDKLRLRLFNKPPTPAPIKPTGVPEATTPDGSPRTLRT